jgi:hypothetical protein
MEGFSMKEKPKGQRHVKCPHCEEYELWNDKEQMIVAEIGKGKKYVHTECYNFFIADLEAMEQEKEQKKVLLDYIRNLHNLESGEDTGEKIPNYFYKMIEDLRQNGNKHKCGYDVILEAYEMAKKYCRNAIKTKKFKSKVSEMVYCLKIVESNILDAKIKIKEGKRKQKIVELREQRMLEDVSTSRKVEYKSKGYEHDILDLFE